VIGNGKKEEIKSRLFKLGDAEKYIWIQAG
jgi:hypothetical protein